MIFALFAVFAVFAVQMGGLEEYPNSETPNMMSTGHNDEED